MQHNYDLADLTAPNKTLHEYYLQRPEQIDLSAVKSEQDVKDICNIITYKAQNTKMGGDMYHRAFIHPLKRILKDYKQNGLLEHFRIKYNSTIPYIHKAATTALLYYRGQEVNQRYVYDHVIYVKNIPIAPERLSCNKILTINCKDVKNPSNQAVIEDWGIYLLTKTTLSVSTISGKVHNLIKILNKYDKHCRFWSEQDARLCIHDIVALPMHNTSKQSLLTVLKDFFTYLAENYLILASTAWIFTEESGLKVVRKYKKTAPDEYVLQQVFNSLVHADDFIKISFLLLYCTGMRISELYSIKKDCLDYRDHGVFLKFYQSKMRKEVSNIIPPNLAEMIKKYSDSNITASEYLFCNTSGERTSLCTLRQKLVAFFKQAKIRNTDGTPYNFTPHSYRHLMAVRMHKYKIPYRYIQEQLHHDSPEMTLFYIEYMDKERIEKMSEWITSNGQKINKDSLLLKIRKSQVETAILPNGLCTRPAILPACQHCNTCIGCMYFTTGKEYLPVLTSQQERLEGFIADARSKGWDKAAENSQRTLTQLNTIINCLEEK